MFRSILRILTPFAVLAAGLLGLVNRAEAQDCGAGGPEVVYKYVGAIVQCEITVSGNYGIAAFGGDGGAQRIDALENVTTPGGLGSGLEEVFSLQAGDVLDILVGGAGARHAPELLSGEIYPGGGGGGTFIGIITLGDVPNPLLIAGGGGGAGTDSDGDNGHPAFAGGGNGEYSNGGTGGMNGNGGGGTSTATGGAGGGGWYTGGGAGPSSSGGQSFMDGGAGGGPDNFCDGAAGGFGGGGGAGWTDCTQDGGGGGGGGWDGGGGGGWAFFGNEGGAGGGGDSYYSPEFFVQSLLPIGFNPFADGNGEVLIRQITNADGTPVPEPGSLALLAVGVAVLAGRRLLVRWG